MMGGRYNWGSVESVFPLHSMNQSIYGSWKKATFRCLRLDYLLSIQIVDSLRSLEAHWAVRGGEQME